MASTERETIKLDIGSGGPSGDPSFIGVDAFAEGADVQAFMWDLPYEDESVDVIVSTQALEHISKFAVVPTLREWNRVLKDGGKLQLQVPDLEWACYHWLSHQTVDWDLDIIYGHQKHEGEYHKTGFTDKILGMYIRVCGGWRVDKINYEGSSLEEAISGTVGISQRVINLEAYKDSSIPPELLEG